MISEQELISILTDNTSKHVSELLGEQALEHDSIFFLLQSLVAAGQQPIAWKAAWSLEKATEEHCEKIDLILPWMYDFLLVENQDGSVRHLMKMLLRRPIIESKAVPLLNKVLDWVNDDKASVSKRVYGLEFMYKIYCIFPDFKSELQSVINHNLENGGQAGFLNRLKKIQVKL